MTENPYNNNELDSAMTSEISSMTPIAGNIISIGLVALIIFVIYLDQKDNELENAQLVKNLQATALENAKLEQDKELATVRDKATALENAKLEQDKELENAKLAAQNLNKALKAEQQKAQLAVQNLETQLEANLKDKEKLEEKLKNLKDKTIVMDYKNSIVNSNYSIVNSNYIDLQNQLAYKENETKELDYTTSILNSK